MFKEKKNEITGLNLSRGLLDQKLSGVSKVSQLIWNGLKPLNLQSAWELICFRYTYFASERDFIFE